MPRKLFSIRGTFTLLVLLIASEIVVSAIGQPTKCQIPPELNNKLHSDPLALKTTSIDYGNIVHFPPSAVLYPETAQDIKTLISSSYNCPNPFVISARGNGHSVQGQAMAPNGVVVDMQEFKTNGKGLGVSVSKDGSYADLGGQLLWSDVLNETLKRGVLPVSWTDYLEITVGGTLSNAGISGQTFRFGPQVSNVYELDVVTGKGEMVTCSPNNNPELFYAVLGGLGQFGVITRARIPVEAAKPRARWLRLLYNDFEQFTKDQEHIISINGRNQQEAMGYLEGQILLDNGTPNLWETAGYFLPKDLPMIMSLVKKYGAIYIIEIACPYDRPFELVVDTQIKQLLQGLSPIPGMVYNVSVPYVDFLTRVPLLEVQKNETNPWLNLFVPKSGISLFNSGVIRNILLKRNITIGPVILYPVNRSKWDQRMSVVTPDEDIFYVASLLFAGGLGDWKVFYEQNSDILKFLDNNNIRYKLYLQSHSTKEEWVQHFGSKWETFKTRKQEFDPKHILTPGQRIFN